MIFLSCTQNKKSKEIYNKKSELLPQKKNKVLNSEQEIGCNFEKILSDPKTPKFALNLFNNNAKYSEEAIDYFEKINEKDKPTKEFYFKVITNSYNIADGAYSEALGDFGKEYIENNPKDFASFFDNKSCFTDTDLKTWAKIALLEFEIIEENLNTEKNKQIVYKYCDKLKNDSKHYSNSQRETIKNFCNHLLNEWEKYLNNM